MNQFLKQFNSCAKWFLDENLELMNTTDCARLFHCRGFTFTAHLYSVTCPLVCLNDPCGNSGWRFLWKNCQNFGQSIYILRSATTLVGICWSYWWVTAASCNCHSFKPVMVWHLVSGTLTRSWPLQFFLGCVGFHQWELKALEILNLNS
jgi:hypothetical protein